MTMEEARLAHRLGLVEEHVHLENQHDLEGVMGTFGTTPFFEDGAWGEVHRGREGVRHQYEALLAGAPDLAIEIVRRHVAAEAVILECMIRGTHLGTWRGLPPTGRRFEFSLCAVYTFDEEEKLASEETYYDRATVLRQLGIFHEPESVPGRVLLPLAHPITTVRILLGIVRRGSR